MSQLARFASEGRFFISSWRTFKKFVSRKYKAFWKKVDRAIANCYNSIKFSHRPIDPNKIVMLTSRGTYNCHPRAIAEEIIKQGLPYEIVWVVRKENIKNNEYYPENLKLVYRGSYEFNEEAATARVWIDNSVTFSYLFAKKRPGQTLIQTWHGTFGLKKFDASVNNNKYWVKKAYQEGKQTDYILTNCKFEEELFKNTFWENAEALPYGHPRNDILFENKAEEAAKLVADIRKRYHIKESTKILLYAPTYRDVPNVQNYEFDYDRVVEALEERFGGKWVIMVRYHFLDRKLANLDESNPNIINVTQYPDIQDLMLIADIGMTDYSSWIYDYFFTRKPGFLYVPDIEEYESKDREFLFPIEETPFPIAKTIHELCKQIENFDEEKYQRDYQTFSDKMACYEDGHATERIVNKLKEIMG